jgi:hypothetical protein
VGALCPYKVWSAKCESVNSDIFVSDKRTHLLVAHFRARATSTKRCVLLPETKICAHAPRQVNVCKLGFLSEGAFFGEAPVEHLLF